ncbi:MAG: BatA domain-containing protein [Planctomycetes bacterium]|nr:BatA domain-containing protein [Planctomycetota bacterium]
MSFLYPLFLAGIAAIGIPIVLHMVRRKTKDRVTFSSLMFVPTSAPRFKNRSRVENILLLLLRCAIVGLLAFAFSRPFFPRPISDTGVRSAERIVLLLDTSASMRRRGLWEQAVGAAKSALEDAGRADSVCIMSFDQDTRIVMGFEQWNQLEAGQRALAAVEQVSELRPSWARTNLGGALVAAAEAIEDDEISDPRQSATARRVVLISDLQQGSELEALGAYEWPERTRLVVRPVRPEASTNAALQLITDRTDLSVADANDRPRVRITNSSDAAGEEFRINWADDTSSGAPNEPVNVYAAPGRSVVVRAPVGGDGQPSGRLILTGDDHDFDNSLYIAPYVRRAVNILYVGGDDPNDSKEMLFYVMQAFGATSVLVPRVVSHGGDKEISAAEIAGADLIIVTDSVTQENMTALRGGIESGGTLLLVMKDAEGAESLAGLAEIADIKVEEAEVDRYAMLGRIEFTHPLFAPFSEPLFGDFTQIHFWKYRRLNAGDLPDARVLAWFDSDDPAMLELSLGKGSLLVLTCGWGRADSQLALSSKFVPLLYSILEYGGVHTREQLQYFVGDRVPVMRSASEESASVRIRKPDGSIISIEPAEESFAETDEPGIYTIESDAGLAAGGLFAVNVSARECQTAPMPIEDIEKLGVLLDGSGVVDMEKVEKARHHSNLAEMEYEQKLWRRLLAALLAVVLVETAVAGWLTRSTPATEGRQT